MKKIIILLSVAIAALAVSCNKVTPQDSTPDAPKGEKITITVSLSDALSKVSLTQDPADPDGAIKVAWEATDKIFVIDASNPNNFEAFSIVAGSIDTEKPYIATFEGTAPDASSFNILYGATSVSAANSFNSEQTQTGNASTDHLQYKALISGVSSIENIEFSKTWAETNGGSFSQNGALRLRIQVPTEVTSVAYVSLTAHSAIFSGSETITVKFVDNVAPVNGIITAYAMLPMGDAIEVADEDFEVTIATAEENEYYKTFSPGAISFKPGQTNAIKLNKNGFSNNLFAGGTGLEGDPYLIATAKHMQNMHIVMKDNAVIYFKMIDEVDMTGIDWEPLNNSGNYLKGINFDGDYHTISNLTVGDSQAYPSFVGVLNGTIKKVVFYKAEINAGSKKAGVVAGYIGTKGITGSCSNVTVNESSVQGTSFIGGFAGQVANDEDSIVDCHVISSTVTQSNETQDAMMETGGFVGSCQAAATFTECSVEGITIISKTPGKAGIGGFVGRTRTATPSFNNCTVSGEITSSGNWTGGFAGYTTDGGSFTLCSTSASIEVSSPGQFAGGFVGYVGIGSFNNCSATGSVSTHSSYAAGFAGVMETVTANNCSASGNISAGGSYSGGFVGCIKPGANNTATISKCWSSGKVTTSSAQCGGFIGSIAANASGTVNVGDCYETGDLVGSNQRMGGLIGQIGSGIITISRCYSKATMTAGSFAQGGLVGFMNTTASIEDCAAWNNEVLASSIGNGNWSTGAVIGVAWPTATLTNNFRNPIMNVKAYWGNVTGFTKELTADYDHPDVSTTNPLIIVDKSSGVLRATSATAAASGQDNYPLFAFHGKHSSTNSLSTLADTAKTNGGLGWSSDIWDFSGDFPTLK